LHGPAFPADRKPYFIAAFIGGFFWSHTMDRVTIYPGAIPLETDLLNTNKNVMVALSKLAAATLGTGTIANGFAVTPTGPASLQVVAAPGEIYSLQNVDGTAYSSIAADTTHQSVKQGILLDASTLNCPAPTTSGQSINYLVEVAYQDLDANPVVLPYYNASNPSQAYSGPANSGVAQNTSRKGVAVIQVKAGASATTGSQVTPAPDAGYIGLYVVTVAFGQTTITSASISQYSGAPMLPSGLLQAVQTAATTGGADIGAANAYAANFTPAITTLTDKMVLCIKAANANTAASTFTPAPGVIAASPIVGCAHSALQGGEIVPTGDVWLQWNSSIGAGSWVLIDSTGGGMQVAPASKSQHAIQLQQMAAVVGGSVNSRMSVTAASATATFTADEVAVKSALGGQSWLLTSFSKTINLAGTGAGGMDTGTAPVNGFVALYAIYNPTTGASALLAVNATSAAAPAVYGGANMPAGYTASALLTVVPTNGSSQFRVCGVLGRRVTIQLGTFFTFAANIPGQNISIAAFVPANAKVIWGELSASCNATANISISVNSDNASALSQQNLSTFIGSVSAVFIGNFANVLLTTPQSVGIGANTTAGTPSFSYYIGGYEI
jgi:hypothetical protein